MEINVGILNKAKAKEIFFGPHKKRRLAWLEAHDSGTDNPWWLRGQSWCSLMKVEVPRNDDRDPHGWIQKVEKYFRYYLTPKELKFNIAYLKCDDLDLFFRINWEQTLLGGACQSIARKLWFIEVPKY